MSDPKNQSLSTSLLVRVRAKEEGAWARLLFLYEPVVAGWCRRAGIPERDIADVSQELFQAILKGIEGFRRERQGDTFRGWLYGVARNKICDYWRKRADEPNAVGGSNAQLALAQVPADSGAAGVLSTRSEVPEVSGLYRRALELIKTEFEERTVQAFWRVAVEQRPAASVAADLGMSPGAVYVAKSRVLKRLREELGDLGDLENVTDD